MLLWEHYLPMPKSLRGQLALTWTDLAHGLAASKVALVPLALGRVPLMDVLHTACLPAVRIVLPAEIRGGEHWPGHSPPLPGHVVTSG